MCTILMFKNELQTLLLLVFFIFNTLIMSLFHYTYEQPNVIKYNQLQLPI